MRTRENTLRLSNAPDLQGRGSAGFTQSPSLSCVSAGAAQTYGGNILALAVRALRGLVGFFVCFGFLYFSQSIRAQEIQPIDLRIEIDASIYSSSLCQKLVNLHDKREDAPWGMTFAKPSRLCTYPGVISKPYNTHHWRLVVSELNEALNFMICRPVPRATRLDEHCSWSMVIKKPKNWRERLVKDDFLFLVVAGLHEQLPIRDFNARGENLSRPEPRIKSERLENPPQLTRGRLKFDRSTGRFVFFPFSRLGVDRKEFSSPDSSFWWLQQESKTARIAAFEELMKDEGYEFISKTELAKILGGKNQQPKPTQIPTAVAPAPLPLKPIFSEALLDDTGVRAEGDDSSFFSDVWNGPWQSEFSLFGFPVPEDFTDRLSSTLNGSFEFYHPLWKNLTTGFQGHFTSEKEIAQLRVNTSLSGQQQLARGSRSTIMAGGRLDLSFQCWRLNCRVGAHSGIGRIDTKWSYDKERTTLSVWSPTGQGLYVQPWIQIEPAQPDLDGLRAHTSFTQLRFADGQWRSFALEGGWLWRPQWALFQWGGVKVSGWNTFVGYRTGQITKTTDIGSSETGTVVSLTTIWLGLQAQLTEILQ